LHNLKLDVQSGKLRIWRFVEGNPVDDGVVFRIRAVAYDLAVKILSDTPAGDVLYGHRIDETSFAESCVSPLNKCGHDFPAETLSVRALLEPKAEFGKRDYAMLAMLFGCGFRRSELVGLELDDIQMRQGHWAVVDLIGKGGHIRTVPIPNWVKAALDQWTRAANIREGKIFRRVARLGKVWGGCLSQNVVWYVVRTCCERAGLEHIAPHDLRRTCAKLCHDRGGELEQIQFLLGHASAQTTERYCVQRGVM
jgi:hypothetical protein